MNERDWMRIKQAQLESCYIIRHAQVTARWAMAVAKATIAQAQRRRITFKGKK